MNQDKNNSSSRPTDNSSKENLLLSLESLSKIIKVCLQVTFFAGVLVTVFLSPLLKYYFGWYFFDDVKYYWACLVLLTPCGLCSLNILWQLIRLFETIHNKNPFVRKNVVGLRRIALSSFGIAAMFFALMFFRATMLTFAMGYVFLIAGFSFVVLAGLFKKAVEFKDENDLTI